MGANVFRSVLGPWGLSLSWGTQPLSSSGSGPELRGWGWSRLSTAEGEPGRLARKGTGLQPRQTGEDSAEMGGRQGGTGTWETEASQGHGWLRELSRKH